VQCAHPLACDALKDSFFKKKPVTSFPLERQQRLGVGEFDQTR